MVQKWNIILLFYGSSSVDLVVALFVPSQSQSQPLLCERRDTVTNPLGQQRATTVAAALRWLCTSFGISSGLVRRPAERRPPPFTSRSRIVVVRTRGSLVVIGSSSGTARLAVECPVYT
uniref:Putative secreted peptide n=1 Tax=Anopheles braziliensis TaxID=58242 RepID=A0A2M3ZUQ8_9DIPT